MTSNAQRNNSPHMLMWIAGIAVILFSAAGIAAIMGWIPISMGHPVDNTQIAQPGKLAADAAPPAAASNQMSAHAFAEPRRTPEHVASNAPARATCGNCGVIESTREIAHKGEGSGAVAGNEVEKRVKSNQGYEVIVRLDDGSSRIISETNTNAPAWRTGEYVKVVGDVIYANP